MDTKFDVLKAEIYNHISSCASKIKPITARTLCVEFNISFRELKRIITELRKDYPIVSKETNGGGYWVAESEDDIINFITMIQKRKDGYEETIGVMNQYLTNYGNIPYID